MSFTGRIRLVLVAVALLPPLLMMVVVYFYSAQQKDIRYRQTAAEDLGKLLAYRERFQVEVYRNLQEITRHSWFERSTRLAQRGRASQIDFEDLRGLGLDFYELLDSTGIVVASAHRPGLVGTAKALPNDGATQSPPALRNTLEYDIAGRHASLAGKAGTDGSYYVYGGRYLEHGFSPVAEQLFRGRLTTTFLESDDAAGLARHAPMAFGSLYIAHDTLQAVVFGGGSAPFTVTAEFVAPDESAVFASFIDAVSLVALVSVLAAVGLGLYISGRSKREFANLMEAFDRVASGDLNTAVMAYSEGEFAHLADSFSEMTRKLRQSQHDLAMTEKIAAWQTMARKIAHEIKNPLTPIGVSADDLRRSYQEKLPGFENTLDSSTRMIRSEVNRLTRLLDEFVSFARMKPPELTETPVAGLPDGLESLYADDIAGGRLSMLNRTRRTTARLDPEQIQQVLVNLIKNALEAGEDTRVTVRLDDHDTGLRLTVSDNGPGFSGDILARQFEPYLTTKKDGSGLGLAICQRIVHDHGGSITLKNKDDGGAEVTIDLPQ